MVASIEDILGLKFVPGARQSAHGRLPSPPSSVESEDDEEIKVPFGVGSEIFVNINGDAQHKASAWSTIFQDADGDMAINVTVGLASIVDDVFLKYGEDLKKVPKPQHIIDEDEDIIITMTPDLLPKLPFKLSNFIEKVIPPPNTPDTWFEGVFEYHFAHGFQNYVNGAWVTVSLPRDEGFQGNFFFKFRI